MDFYRDDLPNFWGSEEAKKLMRTDAVVIMRVQLVKGTKKSLGSKKMKAVT